MASRRRFSSEFKVQVVLELLLGDVTQAQLARRYSLSATQISGWRNRYDAGKLVSARDGQSAMAARVAELERMVGRLTLENDLLERAAAWKQAQGSGDIFSGNGTDCRRSDGGALHLTLFPS